MSKNFADEYKALANEELPDLWNRIEAGLAPKTTALAGEELSQNMEQTVKPVEQTAKPVELEAESVEPEAMQEAEGEEKPEKGKVILFLHQYRTVVAAAVCVIMILPAAILLGRGSHSKSFSESAMDMETEMSEEAVADEAADTTSEELYWPESDEVAEEPASEPEAEAGGADASAAASTAASATGDNGADGAEAYTETARIEELDSEGAAQEKMEQQQNRDVQGAMTDEAADIAEEEKVFSEDQTTEQSLNSTAGRKSKILEMVTLEALEQTGEIVETDGDLFYGMYMKVIEDASGELEKGTEITVWVSYLSSVAYVQGQEYVMDLSYDPDKECPYRVKKNYFS